jgi:hypothetical protein
MLERNEKEHGEEGEREKNIIREKGIPVRKWKRKFRSIWGKRMQKREK